MPKAQSTALPVAIKTAQYRDLNSRIQRAQHTLMYGSAAPARTEPVKVKAARKLVQAYDDRVQEAERRRNDKLREEAAALRSLVLYGDVAKARAAVEKFERRIPKP